MGQNVNFKDYIPPERFDAVSWENAKIEEAPGPSGPWTTIATVSIGAPDVDPADPQPRSFTTNAGTAPDLWYRATFLDAALNTSEPTRAFQNTEAATAGDSACQDWITGDDILDCCDATIGSDVPLSTFAAEATGLLFELSGRRFNGLCQRTVRPCPGRCGCWGAGIDPLSRYIGVSIDGSVVGGASWFDGSYWFGHGGRRGCEPLSRVKLAGYPVQQIVEVTIDGAVVDPAGYALKHGSDLVRLADADGNRQRWPGCQRTDVPLGDSGTFGVTYLYGVAPPVAGVEAAKQLACELVRACPSSGETDECALPPGVVEVSRQGITIRAQTLGLFLLEGKTGLAHVDSFLGVYGSVARRPAVLWSPEIAPFAQEA